MKSAQPTSKIAFSKPVQLMIIFFSIVIFLLCSILVFRKLHLNGTSDSSISELKQKVSVEQEFQPKEAGNSATF